MGKGKATPSKPPRKTRPKPPKQTKDAAVNAVRQAAFLKEKAEWDVVNAVHIEEMKKRKVEKKRLERLGQREFKQLSPRQSAKPSPRQPAQPSPRQLAQPSPRQSAQPSSRGAQGRSSNEGGLMAQLSDEGRQAVQRSCNWTQACKEAIEDAGLETCPRDAVPMQMAWIAETPGAVDRLFRERATGRHAPSPNSGHNTNPDPHSPSPSSP